MKRPLDIKFAERLKELMEKQGYSADKRDVSRFARDTKIKISTLHRWLHGTRPTIYEDLALLADRFSVTLEFLMLGTEKRVTKRLELIYNKNKEMKLKGYTDSQDLIKILGLPDKEITLKVKIESIENLLKTPLKISANKKR